jgi:hypothetical protein
MKIKADILLLSLVYWHRFHADPDPDATFCDDADSDLEHTPSFTQV